MNKKATRILFVGNSITWHPVKEEIGWLNEWGMAASSKDNDFVHLLIKKAHDSGFSAEFKIAWAVAWEREYWDAIHLVAFKEFLNFKPDIIVVKIGENSAPAKNVEYPYKKYYEKLLDYLNPQEKSKIIVCTGFWKRGVIDDAVRLVAAERNYPMVELNHLDEDPKLKAYDIYGHEGPGHHPGDKGMAAIADEIFVKLKEIL